MVSFRLPIPEKISTNTIYAGCHWTKRNKHKEMYRNLGYLVKGKIDNFPVHIKFTFYQSGRLLDATNLSYMAKLLEDMLVTQEIIPDDSPKYVSGITLISSKGNNEVLIEIY